MREPAAISSITAHDLVRQWDDRVQRSAARELSGQAARLLRRCYDTYVEGLTSAGWRPDRADGARRALVRYGVEIGGSAAQLDSLIDGMTWACEDVLAAGRAVVDYLARREVTGADVVPAVAADDSHEPPF